MLRFALRFAKKYKILICVILVGVLAIGYLSFSGGRNDTQNRQELRKKL